MALGPGALTTLAAVRARLNLEDDDTGSNAELESVIMAASAAIENHMGLLGARRTVFEDHYLDGTGVVVLRAAPVVELISVLSLSDDSEIAASGATVDYPNGIVRVIGVGSYRFTLVAGEDPTRPEVQLATQIVVEHMWASQRLGRPADLSGDFAPVASRGYLIPYQAAELLGGKGANPP